MRAGAAPTGLAPTGLAPVRRLPAARRLEQGRHRPTPMTASGAPTATVSSCRTRISRRVPAAGDGISVSTLSVDTSSSGSSASTVSPTFFSQRVTVPSVTLSPSAGMATTVPCALPVGASPPADGASAGWPPSEAGAGADPEPPAGASVSGSFSVDGASTSADGWLSGTASAGCWPPVPPVSSPSPAITASSLPTSATSSAATTIRLSTPLAGDGISVSTLSVETSSSGSSASTRSPSFLSQRVTVPSVTLSPSRGMVTDTGIWCYSLSRARGATAPRVAGLARISRGRAGACRPGPGAPRPGPRSGWGARG